MNPDKNYKNCRPMSPLSSGWFSFPTHITLALIAKLELTFAFLYSRWFKSNFL